jgi:hypothetical protein
MKKLFFLLSMAIALYSFGQSGEQQNFDANTQGTKVPEELLTDDSTYWSITTLSTINYVNTTPGAYYNTYKSGGGMTVKFKFKKDGTYEFMLYVQANTYGLENESWTYAEGTVEFTKDALGQPVFRTHANKGTYRYTKNGTTTSRPIPAADLENQLSNTYLWEKTKLKDDPNNVYMLAIDLDAHPGIDLNHPQNIDHSWISKFHIPAKS